MLQIKFLLLVIKTVCNFICLGWKKDQLFHVGKTFPHANSVLNTLIMGCDEQEVINFHMLYYCHFLHYFWVLWKSQGCSCQPTRVCRRTQLPPRGWTRPGAKEGVLQHPLGKMGLAVSAWPHSSSCYHHEIQEKGCNSNQTLPGIPIPNGGQGMFLSVPELWGVSPWGIFTYYYCLHQEG